LQARGHGARLADRVAPLVRSLRMQLNETASFFIRTGWNVEAIATETSEQALRYAINTGTSLPMHTMASGKAILATMPPEEFERYLAETRREKFTEATITSESRLRKEIEAVRQRGYAITRQEYSLGIHGIGVAVVIGGEAVGAFSVAIPAVRYGEGVEEHAVDLLRRTAGLLEAD
jgi:IclR family transcriptional regulator, acetate operon repressor